MASLSRLILGGDVEKMLAGQFGDIVGHMDKLNSVDTTNIEPLYSPAAHEAFNRVDEAVNTRDRQEILANAPQTDGEYFIVPRIV